MLFISFSKRSSDETCRAGLVVLNSVELSAGPWLQLPLHMLSRLHQPDSTAVECSNQHLN